MIGGKLTTMVVVPVTVRYVYHEHYRGYRDSLARPEEPDEPAFVEIEEVLHDGRPLALSRDIIDRLEEEVIDYVETTRGG